jgi:hypothetical protein
MKIRLQDGLLYVTACLIHQGQKRTFKEVLLDTGSAGTIFATDRVMAMGLVYEPEDIVYRIRGIGGTEFVFSKRVDCLEIGALRVEGFPIEVGAMDYG